MAEATKKRSILDAAKESTRQPVAALPVMEKPAAPVATASNNGEKVSKPKKDDADTLVQTCGHKIGLAHLRGQKCQHCRNEARKAFNALRLAELPAKPIKNKVDDGGRLPDRSEFKVVCFDAAAVMWSAELHVPGAPLFFDSASGVEHLLRNLAMKYREWLRTQGV
jgi:hypothetical protein